MRKQYPVLYMHNVTDYEIRLYVHVSTLYTLICTPLNFIQNNVACINKRYIKDDFFCFKFIIICAIIVICLKHSFLIFNL